MTINKKQLKKIAFVLSLCMLVVWSILGTGASLAWFTDKTSELKNVFHVADFDLDVFYLDPNNDWTEVKEETELFNKNALYEPGYTETVYLKVVNNGDVPFNWHTAVSVYKYTLGKNYQGEEFKLQNYLRFGIVEDVSYEALCEKVKTRDLCKNIAVEVLDNYSTQTYVLDEKGEGKKNERYIAIVVRMPEEVTNVANYKPPHQPEVFLNVIVYASQIQE